MRLDLLNWKAFVVKTIVFGFAGFMVWPSLHTVVIGPRLSVLTAAQLTDSQASEWSRLLNRVDLVFMGQSTLFCLWLVLVVVPYGYRVSRNHWATRLIEDSDY